MKKSNLKNIDYATKTIEQLFSKKLLEESTVKYFNYTSSVVAINDGKGGFTIQKLPPMIQLSSTNAICIADVNDDSKPDLVIGGNKFGFPPQFGRLDASYGDVLINTGSGKFTRMAPRMTGLNLTGEVRDIKEIKSKDKRYILIVVNDQFPVLYQLKNNSGQ